MMVERVKVVKKETELKEIKKKKRSLELLKINMPFVHICVRQK